MYVVIPTAEKKAKCKLKNKILVIEKPSEKKVTLRLSLK